METNKVYLNGEVVDSRQAKISVEDAGFLHGVSTFTTMRAHNGVVFRLNKHLARLFETVEFLGIRSDATPGELEAGVYRVLQANDLTEARVRITLSPGSVFEQKSTTLITAAQLGPYPQDWYDKGIRVAISPYTQPINYPAAGHKTGGYLPRMMAQQIAAREGAVEALWFTVDKCLAEGSVSNVFLVKDGQLYTPPLDTPILPGVIRGTVLELAQKLEIQSITDVRLTWDEVCKCDEMFVTGSCSGIRPVVQVAEQAIGAGKPGPVTRRIMEAYQKLLDTECSGQ